ncbi:MAG: FKBP-type peptidyl-prolyl cis-trans isomerase [Pontibacterium sp.]
MKKTWLAATVFAAALAPSVHALELKTEEQKLSYAFGLLMGDNLKANIEALDLDAFGAAVEDIYKGEEPLLTPEEVRSIYTAFEQKQIQAQREAVAKAAQESLEKGEAYQAENAKKDGVKVTESGLQYETLVEGTGASPTAEDTVKVHYKGTMIGGTVFDSSYDRGEPITFALNGVIPGWTEGVQLMKTGGKTRFVIPSDLAYGPRGAGQAIGPNETLIFEVELLEVNPAE